MGYIQPNTYPRHYTNFNYANGWRDTPLLVKECQHQSPDKEDKTVGNCLSRITCHVCEYTFLIDSSG